MTITVKRSNK
ncbi:hypothetical protein VTL71DRAFT_7374 [Oculimacula yallundae]|uniref:Uncharacterized protein n=1 Tax=Oculimacula yallundae TaxID=86028 RepID=A0ABR4BWG7_9HELO